MHTFIFWPAAGDARERIRIFAQEVAPAGERVRQG